MRDVRNIVEILCHPDDQSDHGSDFWTESAKSLLTAATLHVLYAEEDKSLAEATRTSDFRLTDLQQSDHPVSLYLAIPPSDLQRLRPLLRLFIVQLTSRLTEELPDGADRNKLLLMLDEFPALGGMDGFETAARTSPPTFCNRCSPARRPWSRASPPRTGTSTTPA